MSIRPLLLVLLSAPAILAQGKSLAAVPARDAMIRASAEGVPAILAALPKTAVGRLLAEPDVAAAWDAGLTRFRAIARKREALVQAALALKLASPQSLAARVWQQLDVRDLRYAEILALAPVAAQHMPASYAVIGCTPKAEGRMTRMFEDHARLLSANERFTALPDVKLDGYPVYAFAPVSSEQDERTPFVGPEGVWLLHLPGVLAFGEGKPDECCRIAAEPAPAGPGVCVTLDLKAYIGLFAGFGGGMPTEFAALGFQRLERLQWRVSFAGERVLDECELQLGDKPDGILGALLGGKAALPPQGLPEGALVQLRCAVDHVMLLQSIAALAGSEKVLPEEMQKELSAAFDGGIALGVCAPATGSVIPRMYLTMRIADAAALDRLLPMLLPEGSQRKEVTYEGTVCTVLTPPGMPQAMQPTFCRRDGLLHVAESPLSMRALLEAQKAGVTAMEVGDVPVPQGPGELQPGFELRCDEAAMYRAFHRVWLPLYELAFHADGGGQPLLRRQDMPEPRAVEKLLGGSRGVLRRHEQHWVVQHLGNLGGPELAALAMTWGPILSGSFHEDWELEQLENTIARRKLEEVWPALEAWRKDKGSWPPRLGDLFANRKLADDALLLPGDETAEPVELAAGDERKIRSSFRYFPEPVQAGERRMLFIAIGARRYRRAMMADDGSVPDVWGEDSSKPIDKFAK